MVGPRVISVSYSVPIDGTTATDITDIPLWWNNTGKDWSLDVDNPPVWVSALARTGSGSASDGTQFLKLDVYRVGATAVETGLCSHVLTTGTTFTAKVGEPFDNMTGSSAVIPDGTGVNFDLNFGAGCVNMTVSKGDMLVATFIEGEGYDQS